MNKHNETSEQQALAQAYNTSNYDSKQIGDMIETEYGTYILAQKPNCYQAIDDRTWAWEKTEDHGGEPYMDGPIITIK